MFWLLLAGLFFSSTLAVQFTSEFSQKFDVNAGKQTLTMLTIKADSDTEISKTNGIKLILDESFKLNFDPTTVTGIVLWGTASTKVDTITLSNDYMKLTITLKDNVVKDETITLSNIGVIVYDREQSYKNIGIDINNDNVADSNEPNGLKIDATNTRSDHLAPNEVKNVVGNTVNGKISLTWTVPGDLDFIMTKIEFLDTNKTNIGEDYVYTIGEYQFTPTTATKYVRISTRDRKDNNSEWIIYPLSDFGWTVVTPIVTPITTVTTWTTMTTTTTTTTKYTPTLKSAVLSFIATKLDGNITKYGTNDDTTINQRNLFVKFLENFLSKKLSVNQFNSQLVNHAAMLQMFKKQKIK